MESRSVLLDTNFCIQLLKENDPLHANVLGYFRTFLEKEDRLKLSTVSIAEYCVRGKLGELPLKNLEVIPFNTPHAIRAGEFTATILKRKDPISSDERNSIKDDIKLLAQAVVEREITTFATSDRELIKRISFLSTSHGFSLEVIDTLEPYTSVLGLLPFDD